MTAPAAFSLADLQREALEESVSSGLGGTTPIYTHTADNTITNTSETILAANTARKGFIVQNVHATENARVNLNGEAATTTKGIQLRPGGILTISGEDVPTNALTAIREGSSDTTLHVVEIT